MKTAVIATKCFKDFQIISWHLMDLAISELIIAQNNHISSLLQKYADNHPELPVHILSPEKNTDSSNDSEKYNALLDNCDRLVVFWNGKHKGIASLIKEAREMGKEVSVVYSYPTSYRLLVNV
ncbi:MAG TPA: hypothetical protein VK921_11035 [Anditalea sp.]|nr:hypothetical protein [Anditalea sp.]